MTPNGCGTTTVHSKHLKQTMTMRKTIALTFALLLMLTACSGSDDDTTTDELRTMIANTRWQIIVIK